MRGGAGDCPYTYMKDLVAENYWVPWEDEITITDGTSCGFAEPTRNYAPQPAPALPGPLRKAEAAE